ncbi:MAG: hypothetical protein QOK44_2121, partial [Betaproteobacteria bacterium]|nr:hypothetical protein [Betaproteobacteria bacterium]
MGGAIILNGRKRLTRDTHSLEQRVTLMNWWDAQLSQAE